MLKLFTSVFGISEMLDLLEHIAVGVLTIIGVVLNNAILLLWQGDSFTAFGTIVFLAIGTPLAFTGLMFILGWVSKVGNIFKKGKK